MSSLETPSKAPSSEPITSKAQGTRPTSSGPSGSGSDGQSTANSGPATPGWRATFRIGRDVVRGNVLMVGLVSLFTDFSSEMIYPFLPVFIAGLVPVGMAPVYVGIMEGVAEATSSLLKLVSGRFSDKIGKRKALVGLGYGLSSLLRPVTAFASAGWHVVGLRLGDRIGKGVRTAPRDALISDTVDKKYRGFAFSFHRAMDHTGAVLGPLASIAILYGILGDTLWHGSTGQPSIDEMMALRWLFALALLPGLAAMAVILLGVREVAPKPPPAEGPSGGERLPRSFYAFVFVVTLFALGNSSDLFLLFYGKTLFGLDLASFVGLWIVLHLSKIISSLPGGYLSDRLGRTRIIVAGWLLYAAVYAAMTAISAEWHFWALMAIYGLYYGMTEGAEKALVADFASSARRGTAFGIYHSAIGLAALPASLMFGVFWAKLGPRIAFSIGAGLAGLASLLLIGVLAAQKRRRFNVD